MAPNRIIQWFLTALVALFFAGCTGTLTVRATWESGTLTRTPPSLDGSVAAQKGDVP